jgi:serine/threonine protein kinase
MLYGTVPFKGTNMDELHSLIKSGTYSLKDEVSKEGRKLIKSILEVNPQKRLRLKEILETEWMQDVPETLDIFTENEKETIKKELTYANTRRINRNFGKDPMARESSQFSDGSNVFPFFTEHELDMTQNSLVRNRTTKSVILAPFNSTLTHISEDESAPTYKKSKVMRFGVKVKDIDRQYENNNNCDLDNGVFNEFIQKTDSDEAGNTPKDSISSIKRTEDSKMGNLILETEEDDDTDS